MEDVRCQLAVSRSARFEAEVASWLMAVRNGRGDVLSRIVLPMLQAHPGPFSATVLLRQVKHGIAYTNFSTK